MEKRYPINSNTIDESNLFIRVLLYELDSCFDRFIWNYNFQKISCSNFVILGYADINYSLAPVYISMTYEQKGKIKELIFSSSHDLSEDTLMGITKCIENARQTKISTFRFSAQILNIPLNNYSGNNFKINLKERNSYLTFDINGVNEKDAKNQFNIKAKKIIDFISLAVNETLAISLCIEKIDANTKNEQINQYCKSNKHFISGDCQDGNSIYLLHSKVIEYIDKILENKSFSIFDNACRVYNTALNLYHEFLNNKKMNFDYNEIAAITFMSALETIATYNTENKSCTGCDQSNGQRLMIYKIKDKVIKFVKKYYQECAEKQIKNYYDLRSSFVHSGKQFAKYEYNNSDLQIPYFEEDSKSYISIDNEWSNGFKMIVGYTLRHYFIKNI